MKSKGPEFAAGSRAGPATASPALFGGRGTALLPVFLLAASFASHAQEQESSGRTFVIQPRFDTTATLTSDTHQLGSAGKDAALILQFSPGVNVSSNGGRVRGFLDYSLSRLATVKSPMPDQFQNALNSAVTIEAIDNLAYVDVRGSISRQTVSAFGIQTANGSTSDANRAEVWNLSVSPYVRGTFANLARVEARVNLATTNTRKSSIADSSSGGVQITASGLNQRALLNWSMEASAQTMDYKVGRRTEDARLRGSLNLSAINDLVLSVTGGAESNNYTSAERESHATYGLSAQWTPTERTKLSANREHRFYGESHSFSFEHRFPRSIIRVLDMKDVSGYNGQGNGGTLGTVYDLYYAVFASVEPDPIKRQIFVLNFLQAQGINPSTVVVTGFLNSGPTLTRRQEASLALMGVRDTVTLLASRGESSRLNPQSPVQDDLSNSAIVRQTGISMNLSHRLTPNSSLGLTLYQQKTSGVQASQSSTMRTITANWSGSLGAKTAVSLGARYVTYKAILNSYDESALYANLSRQF